MGQTIHIVFTHCRKQRPLSDTVQELSDFIDQHFSECSNYIRDPTTLVGKHIEHQFVIDDTGNVKWYNGTVLAFDAITKAHVIEYKGEEDHCYFDLTTDLLNGDISVGCVN